MFTASQHVISFLHGVLLNVFIETNVVDVEQIVCTRIVIIMLRSVCVFTMLTMFLYFA